MTNEKKIFFFEMPEFTEFHEYRTNNSLAEIKPLMPVKFLSLLI